MLHKYPLYGLLSTNYSAIIKKYGGKPVLVRLVSHTNYTLVSDDDGLLLQTTRH